MFVSRIAGIDMPSLPDESNLNLQNSTSVLSPIHIWGLDLIVERVIPIEGLLVEKGFASNVTRKGYQAK